MCVASQKGTEAMAITACARVDGILIGQPPLPLDGIGVYVGCDDPEMHYAQPKPKRSVKCSLKSAPVWQRTAIH